LNALENIRSSINVSERGRTMTGGDDAHDFARLALAETGDAIKVLSKRAQAKNLEPGILSARANVTAAAALPQVAQHTPRFDNVFQTSDRRVADGAVGPRQPGLSSGLVPEMSTPSSAFRRPRER
jgi:hypothetical protein